jgi:hypothetical protein
MTKRSDEDVSKSAESYGLPTTYQAALEEVHAWRESADGGAMTPSGLRQHRAAMEEKMATAVALLHRWNNEPVNGPLLLDTKAFLENS